MQSGPPCRIRRALRAYPYLSRFIDVSDLVWKDMSGFYVWLDQLAASNVEAMIAEVDAGPHMHPNTKSSSKQRLHEYLSAWSGVNRRICFAGVTDPSGEHISDPKIVADRLAEHWGK
eukprot:8291448-Pyramimonas_sp.AAC.1